MFNNLIPKIFYGQLQQGLDFFHEGLGFQLLHQDETLAVVTRDGANPYLVQSPEYAAKDRPELAVETDDIETIYAEMAARATAAASQREDHRAETMGCVGVRHARQHFGMHHFPRVADQRSRNPRMNTQPKPSVVVFAKHVDKLARFHREVAGMEEIHADKSHVVLDGGHFQLVVHNIPKKIAATIEITDPPRIRDAMPIKICLPVPSIHSARMLAATLGGKVGAKKKEWQARGFTACDGHDLEGNVFQVRESAEQPGGDRDTLSRP